MGRRGWIIIKGDRRRGRPREVSVEGCMGSAIRGAAGLIALTIIGLTLIVGCAGPRWTGLSDIKKKEMAPEYDTVRITSRPSTAKVFVGERLVGLTPINVALSFRRVKCYRENFLMDGDKIVERKRVDNGMEYFPEHYDIKIYKRGYRAYSLRHKGDNQDGRYHANIVLQEE
jgi:hypothetical protein